MEDEGDSAARSERWGIVSVGVIVAVVESARALIEGDSLAAYGRTLGYVAAFFWALWVFVPRFAQFEARSRVIRVLASDAIKSLTEVHEKVDRLQEALCDVERRMEREDGAHIAALVHPRRSAKLPLPD